MIRIPLIAATLTLAACAASTPPNFYALDPVAPVQAHAGTTVAPLVVAVTLPELLDRPQLVRSLGGGRIDLAEGDRWAAPLDDLVRSALSRDLALRLPGRVVSAERPAGGAAPQILTVTVDIFAADAAGTVTLDGRWFLSGPHDGDAAASRPFHVSVAAEGASAGAVVAAMSTALGQLADQISAI